MGTRNALYTLNTGFSSNKRHQTAFTGLKASIITPVNIRKEIKIKAHSLLVSILHVPKLLLKDAQKQQII